MYLLCICTYLFHFFDIHVLHFNFKNSLEYTRLTFYMYNDKTNLNRLHNIHLPFSSFRLQPNQKKLLCYRNVKQRLKQFLNEENFGQK